MDDEDDDDEQIMDVDGSDVIFVFTDGAENNNNDSYVSRKECPISWACTPNRMNTVVRQIVCSSCRICCDCFRI